MKFFRELRSCYRPQATSSSAAPPSSDYCHRVPLDASDCSHGFESNGARRYRLWRWQPALSSIEEDHVARNHNNKVNQKSGKKSSGECKLRTMTRCPDRNKSSGVKVSMGMSISSFSATPFMF